MNKYKNHYQRIEAATKIITKMLNENYSDDEIIKAVFIDTALGKTWTAKTLDIIRLK